jgi:PKHD-type hydroxylase
MLLPIADLLIEDQIRHARQLLESAEWIDGRITAGHQAVRAKNNHQLPEDSAASASLRELVLTALARSPLFLSAALPLQVFPPLFNRYSGGQNFSTHVDNAIRQITNTGQRIRTDLSATVFLAQPGEYEGGELVVEDTYGAQTVKLPAGHMILYPATSLHHVRPVTSGTRLASFFWIQSMVRDDGQRTILFDLDSAIRRLNDENPLHASAVQLTGVYHNLLRQWAEV